MTYILEEKESPIEEVLLFFTKYGIYILKENEKGKELVIPYEYI